MSGSHASLPAWRLLMSPREHYDQMCLCINTAEAKTQCSGALKGLSAFLLFCPFWYWGVKLYYIFCISYHITTTFHIRHSLHSFFSYSHSYFNCTPTFTIGNVHESMGFLVHAFCCNVLSCMVWTWIFKIEGSFPTFLPFLSRKYHNALQRMSAKIWSPTGYIPIHAVLYPFLANIQHHSLS